MNFLIVVFALLGSFCLSMASELPQHNIFCIYDSSSSNRQGQAEYSLDNLEYALQYCTHLIYGYAGIRGDTFETFSLNEDLDIHRQQFSQVTALKRKFPKLKVLLSVGGDHDIDDKYPNKYLDLLLQSKSGQEKFIRSAHSLVKNYGFDGLDLAYQFPRTKPKKVHCAICAGIKKIKKIFTGDYVVDPKADLHKEQFTILARDLKSSLSKDGFLLSLTVLPNVDSFWYYDIPALNKFVDFVTLAAFDFFTPARNPEEADYSGPLHFVDIQKRLPQNNANYQVTYWIEQGFETRRLNLGFPTYGNAWKMTKESGDSGKPIIDNTAGPAPAGPQSKKPGLLSYTEICQMIQSDRKSRVWLKSLDEYDKRYGTCAFRPASDSNNDGIWVTFEDVELAHKKARYVKERRLGGVAVFDLAYDDFMGLCKNEKHPLLKIIHYKLTTIEEDNDDDALPAV